MNSSTRRSPRRFWLYTLLTLGLLWWTNPNREAYVQYSAGKHEAEIIEECRVSGPIESWICESLLRFPGVRDAIRDHIDEHTQDTNYLFASVYRTNLHALRRSYLAVGVLGHFVELRSSEVAR